MDRKWKTLIAIGFGTYMSTLDMSIVNIALPQLSAEFSASPSTVVWLSLVTALFSTGLTLTAGRSGDIFGKKRVYLLGYGIFTVGLAIAPFAQSIVQLIAVRALQAVGGAMALGNSNAIVVDAFPQSERGRALGTTGAVVGAGLTTGPLLGGAIIGALDWRALFYLRVPLGLLALLAAYLVVQEKPRQGARARLDIPGAITLFLALSMLLLGVNRGTAWGWSSRPILGLLAGGTLFLGAFVWIESRATSPVVSLALFKIRVFAASIVNLILNFAGQAGVTFLMPFYLVQVKGYSTTKAGLVTMTIPVMMLTLSPLSGYLSDRFGVRYQMLAGTILVTLGMLWLATIQPDTPMWLLQLRLALLGLGSTLFQSPNSSTIMGSVPPAALGTASASVATGRNLGNAAGLALAGTVLSSVSTSAAGVTNVRPDRLPPDALLQGVHAAFLAGAAVCSLGIIASLVRGHVVRNNFGATGPSNPRSVAGPRALSESEG